MEHKPLTWAKIELANLVENFNTVRKIVGDNTKIMAIVKADGYGHGAVKVTKALFDAGADCFGVANLKEALEIRINARISKDIFILSGGDRHAFFEIVKYRLTPIMFNLESLKELNGEAARAGKKVKVHLKFDTSMGRLGFFADNVESVINEVLQLENIEIDGIMSHFSSADEDDLTYSMDQLTRFNNLLNAAKKLGVDPAYKHISNSAGIINIKEARFNLVRPGIMLYGSPPSKVMSGKVDLKPVMSIYSSIIQIKDFPKGAFISYSRTFQTSRKSKIAVVQMGYADGYPRALSNKAHMLIHGQKAPVVGNVTMDLTMIDVTDIPGANVGDTVTVLGRDGELCISAWDLAENAQTISYEIMTGISKRVVREYRY